MTQEYTGTVTVGGPSAVRELGTAVIRKIAVGTMANNAYLVTCRRSGAQLLIDPAADSDALLAFVREGSGSARLDAIVVTHRHPDHVGALWDMHATTGAPVAVGDADADAVGTSCDVHVARRLRDGDTVALGSLALRVVALRGHTPGSVALLLEDPSGNHLFTGDSLFPGGVGRTTSPEEFEQLLGDVTTRLFDVLPDDTWVYPGHGDDTTLGRERPSLPRWRERGW